MMTTLSGGRPTFLRSFFFPAPEQWVAGGPAFGFDFCLVPSMLRVPHPCVLCKGGRRCPRQRLCYCQINPVAQSFVVPALRKGREGRGTHCVWSCPRSQKPGPPRRKDGAPTGLVVPAEIPHFSRKERARNGAPAEEQQPSLGFVYRFAADYRAQDFRPK